MLELGFCAVWIPSSMHTYTHCPQFYRRVFPTHPLPLGLVSARERNGRRKKTKIEKKRAEEVRDLWSPCLIHYQSCRGRNACSSFSGWLTWYPINPGRQKCWMCTAATAAKETFVHTGHLLATKPCETWGPGVSHWALKISLRFKEGKILLRLPGMVKNALERGWSIQTQHCLPVVCSTAWTWP